MARRRARRRGSCRRPASSSRRWRRTTGGGLGASPPPAVIVRSNLVVLHAQLDLVAALGLRAEAARADRHRALEADHRAELVAARRRDAQARLEVADPPAVDDPHPRDPAGRHAARDADVEAARAGAGAHAVGTGDERAVGQRRAGDEAARRAIAVPGRGLGELGAGVGRAGQRAERLERVVDALEELDARSLRAEEDEVDDPRLGRVGGEEVRDRPDVAAGERLGRDLAAGGLRCREPGRSRAGRRPAPRARSTATAWPRSLPAMVAVPRGAGRRCGRMSEPASGPAPPAVRRWGAAARARRARRSPRRGSRRGRRRRSGRPTAGSRETGSGSNTSPGRR